MSDFIDKLIGLAETAGKLLNNETIPAALDIANNVIELIHSAKAVVSSDDAATLDASLQTLETQVLAHADRTENTLRG
jgi:hypothetical protein